MSELAKKIAHAVIAVDADQPSAEIAIDTELQEVREVLYGISDDGCYDACKYRREEGHSEACQRACVLMEKLKV